MEIVNIEEGKKEFINFVDNYDLTQEMIANNKYSKIEYADSILRMLGYMFDINFKSSFEIIKEEQYIDRMINRFKFKDEYTQKAILEAGKQMNNYLLNKIQK